MASPDHTPAGRGYDTSFGYFHHDNDFWTERLWSTYNDTGYSPRCNATIVDLWRANGTRGRGAAGENGTAPTSSDWARVPPGCNGTVEAFEEHLFAREALGILRRHDNATGANPFFLNYDMHIAHEPIELPRVYVNTSGDAHHSERGVGTMPFLILSGSPHVRPTWVHRACGEPNTVRVRDGRPRGPPSKSNQPPLMDYYTALVR